MSETPANEAQKNYMVTAGDIRPVPDPTALTTSLVEAAKEDIRRELSANHNALQSSIDSVLALLQGRLEASDKAIVLLQTSQDRIPAHVGEKIGHLQALVEQKFATQEERFRGISLQFEERDVRGEQSERTTKVAIDAALQAQKEMGAAQNINIAQSLARIEATGQKQVEQVVTLSQTSTQATNDKIDDVKERLSLIEGRTAGITAASTSQLTNQQASQGASANILGIIAAVISVVAVVVSILLVMFKS